MGSARGSTNILTLKFKHYTCAPCRRLRQQNSNSTVLTCAKPRMLICVLSVESEEVLVEEQEQVVDPTPPVLPAPHIDLSISMDSILAASVT